MALRAAATIAVSSLGVRRVSEVAQHSTDDVRVDVDAGFTDLVAKRQKNDQLGLGQLPHLMVIEAWGEACPVRLLSG